MTPTPVPPVPPPANSTDYQAATLLLDQDLMCKVWKFTNKPWWIMFLQVFVWNVLTSKAASMFCGGGEPGCLGSTYKLVTQLLIPLMLSIQAGVIIAKVLAAYASMVASELVKTDNGLGLSGYPLFWKQYSVVIYSLVTSTAGLLAIQDFALMAVTKGRRKHLADVLEDSKDGLSQSLLGQIDAAMARSNKVYFNDDGGVGVDRLARVGDVRRAPRDYGYGIAFNKLLWVAHSMSLMIVVLATMTHVIPGFVAYIWYWIPILLGLDLLVKAVAPVQKGQGPEHQALNIFMHSFMLTFCFISVFGQALLLYHGYNYAGAISADFNSHSTAAYVACVKATTTADFVSFADLIGLL
jgi:hypothetical protein